MESYLPYVLTKEQADELQLYLDSIPARLHHTKAAASSTTLAALLPAFAFQALPKKIQDTNEIESVATTFQEDINARTPIRIITPITASVAFLERIQTWVGEHASSPCILEVVADRSIGAGVIVELKGRRYDYTLKYSI